MQVKCATTNTVKELKKIITGYHFGLRDTQMLYFDDTNLKDNRTLDQCGLGNGTVLTHSETGAPLNVKTDTGLDMAFSQAEVNRGSTVADLKMAIFEKAGIPCEKQFLAAHGKALSEDQRQLMDYNLLVMKNGGLVFLSSSPPVSAPKIKAASKRSRQPKKIKTSAPKASKQCKVKEGTKKLT